MKTCDKEQLEDNGTALRTLYECSHAIVHDSRIYCDKGYMLSRLTYDGSLDVDCLERGAPLALGLCQDCIDFDRMGNPVPDNERGWLQ